MLNSKIIFFTPRIPNKQLKTGCQFVLFGDYNFYTQKYDVDIISRFNLDEKIYINNISI